LNQPNFTVFNKVGGGEVADTSILPILKQSKFLSVAENINKTYESHFLILSFQYKIKLVKNIFHQINIDSFF